uniref:Uncharacterized protein n=1 Tax=Anguilla anguilla TaxID=7936 RepID=A0A0E9W007_ANGAN
MKSSFISSTTNDSQYIPKELQKRPFLSGVLFLSLYYIKMYEQENGTHKIKFRFIVGQQLHI